MKLLTSLPSFDALPPKFAPQKPMRELPDKDARNLRDFIIQRKRDGQRHYVLVQPNGRVRLYSSTIRDMTAHFPLIVHELEEYGLPPKTVLDGEIICDRLGVDDMRATNECCRAHAPVSQTAERRLPIRYMPFDLLWYRAQPIWQLPYHERWTWLDGEIPDSGDRVLMPETFARLDLAQRKVTSRKWEGLVLWDPNAPNKIRLDGINARHGNYKWKPVQERDFVAVGWDEGKGKHKGRMGYLVLAEWQYDADGIGPAKLREIGHVGTGFTDTERTEAMRWKYPCVVSVQFMFQQPDSRALREPRFLKRETNKKVTDLK
jgi:ATP-dependent DNA ligase